MDRWKDLQLRKLSCEKDLQTAYRLVLNFFNNQGFEYCAFSAYLGSPHKHTSKVDLNNYPYGWDRFYEQNGYAANDPVVAHCNQSTLPILWEESVFAKAPSYGGNLIDWDSSTAGPRPFMTNKTRNAACSASHGLIAPSISRSTMEISATPSMPVKNCMPWPAKLADAITAQPKCHLSPREIEVLRWSAEGKTASEVGRILCLSERTVNFHVCSCMRKLNVSNKISAVAKPPDPCDLTLGPALPS